MKIPTRIKEALDPNKTDSVLKLTAIYFLRVCAFVICFGLAVFIVGAVLTVLNMFYIAYPVPALIVFAVGFVLILCYFCAVVTTEDRRDRY
jgi:hypothetical protein